MASKKTSSHLFTLFNTALYGAPQIQMKKLSLDFIKSLEAREAAEAAAGKPSSNPYEILLRIALGQDNDGKPFALGSGPSLTLRAECAQYLLRTRLPVLARSENRAEVTTTNTPTAIPRQAVLEALQGCKSAGDLQKVLEGKKVLLLNEGINDGEIIGTNQ
jgi:hypothetical protein